MDPAAHGIVVRYFTDNVTEMDLASSFNEDGSVKLHADGYPLSTRTDVMMSIYDTPAPSNEELEKRIMLSAPVDWLKLQEDIKNPDVNTKLSDARNLTGESKTFSKEQVEKIRAVFAESENIETTPEMAQKVVGELMDSLKILSNEDPHVIKAFAKLLNDLQKVGD